jgi:hypothetical protein
MSDLQTALIAIGACVVAGVLAFNWWQERQFRRRAELAFDNEHADVLMPAKAPGAEAAPMRVSSRGWKAARFPRARRVPHRGARRRRCRSIRLSITSSKSSLPSPRRSRSCTRN